MTTRVRSSMYCGTERTKTIDFLLVQHIVGVPLSDFENKLSASYGQRSKKTFKTRSRDYTSG